MMESQRIPKTIHYVWIGDAEFPPLVQRCLASYSLHAADFDLVFWDNTRSQEVLDKYPFAREAFDAGLYAFASDVIRLHALYYQGGVYLDSDLELHKSLTPYLHHRFFAGLQDNTHVSTALLAAEKEHPLVEALLQQYASRRFIDKRGEPDLTTITRRLTGLLQKRGMGEGDKLHFLDDGITIYPREIFCPFHPKLGGEVTENTVATHHYNGSWLAHRRAIKARRKLQRHRRRQIVGGVVLALCAAALAFYLL